MKKILLFGAGKSATVLIDYLVQTCLVYHWQLTVADGNFSVAESKLKGAANAIAVEADVKNDQQRNGLIEDADLVISMLPAKLHFLVAQHCITAGKHLLTASYVDNNVRLLEPEIKRKGLLFLCEMGLDPGIDHMSAMQLIQRIRDEGGQINSFYSHCGGLVAPESDNNPWHYKVSWNPRNIVLAGKSGAVYKENNQVIKLSYASLFDPTRTVMIPGQGIYAWYPNRDSLGYTGLYGLEDTQTFIRTTLRHPHFCLGWKKIVELQLTDESILYDTDGMRYATFFTKHLVNIKYNPQNIAPGIEQQLLQYLGLYSNELINKGSCCAADILQTIIEKKLALQPHDKDMIIMLHEIGYILNGTTQQIKSHLVVKGDNSLATAMAKTVGLPLGIAAKLILSRQINLEGLHIPVLPEIYEPVMNELQKEGIVFHEKNGIIS